MSKYLIDTNVLVDFLRGKTKVDKSFFEDSASISVITFSELLYGAEKSSSPEKNLGLIKDLIYDLDIKIIDFNSKMSHIFGKLKLNLEKRGKKIEDFDLLIASTAISENKTLVTNNLKHFSRVDALVVISPNI